jgi:urease accessory protein
MNHFSATALLVVGLVLSNVVHAHIGSDAHGSFASGLLHPFSGPDHMLAMIAVGLWAAQVGGRALLALPAVFIASMTLGATVAIFGGSLPFVEGAIAISVLVLGLLIALAVRAPWQFALPLVALFALFHGYVHGEGIPEFANPPGYVAGVLMATASLHAFGVAVAVLLQDRIGFLRAGGMAISIAGACLVLAA